MNYEVHGMISVSSVRETCPTDTVVMDILNRQGQERWKLLYIEKHPADDGLADEYTIYMARNLQHLEHKYSTKSLKGNQSELKGILNGQGEEGYKLCHLEKIPTDGNSDSALYTAYMGRESPSEEQYEHSIINTEEPISIAGLIELLNEQGKDGLELCHLEKTPVEDSDDASYTFYMAKGFPSSMQYEHSIEYVVLDTSRFWKFLAKEEEEGKELCCFEADPIENTNKRFYTVYMKSELETE